MKKLKGVIPVLLTPFVNKWDVDHQALTKLVKHLNTKRI